MIGLIISIVIISLTVIFLIYKTIISPPIQSDSERWNEDLKDMINKFLKK